MAEIVSEHTETYSEQFTRDYTDGYIKEMRSCNAERGTFTEVQLCYSLVDLFVAGTETSAVTVRWAVHNPDIQDRIHEEIDRVIGTSRQISLSDRHDLPYCEAFITEVHRCGNILPLAVQHSNDVDTQIHGYDIPAGSVLIPNLDSAHSDPNEWEHPEKFDPTRCLDIDGRLCNFEKVIPFSIGRRACLGEFLARTELFLLLTSLLQRFKCVPEKGKSLPVLDGILSITREPVDFDILLQRRL